jgi:hypothetical protein
MRRSVAAQLGSSYVIEMQLARSAGDPEVLRYGQPSGFPFHAAVSLMD